MPAWYENLGQGMETAGGILSPAVAQRQAQERDLLLRSHLALQQAQKELAARTIVSGVQSGSIDPQLGRQKLAQLGFGDIPVGPSLEAQGTKAFIDWQGGKPSAAAMPSGMSPQPGMGAPTPQTGISIPPAAAIASPFYGRYIEGQRAQLEAERARQTLDKPPPTRTRIEGQNEIVEQWDPGTRAWTKIGEGPRFSKQVAPVINVGGEKGWQLGTAGGKVVRVNANMGQAVEQQPDGTWKKINVPPDFMVTSASTAGLSGPADQDNTAKLISEYRLAPPSSFAMARPQGKVLMDHVRQLNPEYDDTLYYRKKKMEGEMGGGQTSKITRSFNVFIQHTEVMRDAVNALANGDVQQFNKLSQAVAQQTGRPAPTTFDAVKKIYGDELVKAIVGTGGNVSDREAAADAINRSQSPQQLLSVLDSYDHLMAGQVMGTRKQYESATGRQDFDKFLLPKTLDVLKQYGYSAEGAKTEAPKKLTYDPSTGTFK